MLSCSDKKAELVSPGPVIPVELAEKIMMDVSYGTDVRNKMDVFLPAKRGNSTPFIVLLHGGVWTVGDKKEIKVLQDSLGKRGIASMNMNYRYTSPTFHLSDMMGDISSAIAYAKSNATSWSLNLDKIAIGGVSSGAQMVMMYAYKYDAGNTIDCIVSGAGPTLIDDRNFLDGAVLGNGITAINYMVGDEYTTGGPISQKFTDASPIKNFKNIPLLMLHGTSDNVVPYAQSQFMADALAAAGVPHKLVTVNGVGHDLNLTNPSLATGIFQEIDQWVKTYEK